MSALQQVLAALPQLSREDLAKVRAAAAELSKIDTAIAGGAVDEVYNAIARRAKERGIRWPPISILRRSRTWSAFEQASGEVWAFVCDNCGKERVYQRRMLNLFLEGFLTWMSEVGIPVAPETVSRNLRKLPGMVDRWLPGYAGAGLLKVVCRMDESGTIRPKRRRIRRKPKG